ncbi:MAG: hypothetical protein ACKV2U_18125 [Bryobacteraceae bacterium]
MTITRRIFLGAASLAPLAARNWERAPFPEWTEEYVDRLLTDSPWAKSLTVPFRFSAPARRPLVVSEYAQIGEPLGLPKGWPGSSGPGTGPANRTPRIDDGNAPPVQTEIYLTTRWSSALPMRQALALHQFGRGGLNSAKAMELLRENDAEYVLDVAGFPAGMIPQGVRRFEAELLASATLLVKGRKAVRATASRVPEHGNHLVATLRFPRLENLSDGDGLLDFSAEAGPMEIHQRFKLRDMKYKGRLEL